MTSVAPRSICIVGAGAIGGYLGVQLSHQGHHVTFFGRGAHLAAMQQAQGLKLVKPDGTVVSSAPGCSFVSDLCQVSIQDVVILGLKMHQIGSILPSLHHIVGEETIILTTQNGIPWWYFQKYRGPKQFADRTVQSVDPGGVLKQGIDADKIIASVVYPAAHISAPGEITVVEGVRFPVGEPSGETTARVKGISEMLIDAGFKSPILEDVRGELWLKLWGTVAVNPLSALTHATLDELCTVPFGRSAVMGVMKEVEAVANALGSKMRLPAERRVDGAARVGKHKTSMLQDVEAGRELEIDTIMGGVVELAGVCAIATPCIDTVYGAVRMLQHMMRKESARVCLVPLRVGGASGSGAAGPDGRK